MGFPRSSAALKDLETLFAGGTVGALADGELLERFVARRDEAAFEALVKRHGPMVLQVCRGVLADAHEARRCLPGHVSGPGATSGLDSQARVGRELAVRRGRADRGSGTRGSGPAAKTRVGRGRGGGAVRQEQRPDVARERARTA